MAELLFETESCFLFSPESANESRMSELGHQTSQRPPERARTTTFLDLLRGQMDGLDRPIRRKRSLKERLGFKGIGCCGPTWGLRRTNNTILDARDNEPDQNPAVTGWEHRPDSTRSGMNLAAALAAERHHRTRDEEEGQSDMTPLRMSLMRLLEETAERVSGTERLTASNGAGNDSVCCVCMGRKKGAAFIPCGHTFCRVCSRELWLNRGSCPLCNRPIVEILDIY